MKMPLILTAIRNPGPDFSEAASLPLGVSAAARGATAEPPARLQPLKTRHILPSESEGERLFPQAGRTWLMLCMAALFMWSHLNALAYTVTTLADSGPGSLRAGIVSGAGSINFNVTGTITLTSGELLINHDVSISGPGANQLTISGNHASRVFNISGGSIGVRISDLTIANGLAAGGDGGGIYYPSSSYYYFTRLAVTGNMAGHDGGGMYIGGSGGYVQECTLSGNTAGHDGGGFYNAGNNGGYLEYSTVSGNSAARHGGGVFVNGGYLEHVTVTLNLADSDNDGDGNGGGVYCNNQVQYILDCILANNFDTPNNAGPGVKHEDISGPATFDRNLIKNPVGWLYYSGLPNLANIFFQDPLLGPLANNGGPTLTHALLAGSPALDAASTDYYGGHDQRGQPIADSDCDGLGQPDIGAYEAGFNIIGANNPPPTIVSATADCHSGKITVTFSGPVDAATATSSGNYVFSGGPAVIVNNATYGANKKIVLLDISGFADQTIYTLTIISVQNLCGTATAANVQTTLGCPSEIRGRVFADVDHANGCTFTTGTDVPLANWKVQANPGGLETLTDANGDYYFVVAPGTYTINEVVQANWAQTCPASTYTVPIGAVQVVNQQNFANQATANVSDLAVDMVTVYPSPLTSPCCDQEMTYIISYKNNGTVAVLNPTVQLNLVQGTTYQSFTANPPLAAPSGTYTWTIPGLLQPTAQGLIFVKVKVDACAAAATPLLIANAVISPSDSGGGYQADNTSTHSVLVSCSYDPNDLQVTPKGCGSAGLVPRDTTLTYLILFQNLGSGPANQVVVRDTLNAALDLSTVKVLGSSHAFTQAFNGSELVWTFAGIGLPAAAANEPGSHGFIRFQVHTLASAVAGTAIPNTAQIYFDLNPAVVTTTTLNTLTDNPVPVASYTVSSPSPLTRNFTYTGATPGATLQWDFGTGAVPSTATGPNPTGVVFPLGLQRAVLRVSVSGCEAAPAVKVFTVNSSTLLHASRSGQNMIITWDGSGQLQSANQITGPWINVQNATSPYSTLMNESQKFFRLQVQ